MDQNTTIVLIKVNTRVVCNLNTSVLNSLLMKLNYGDRLRIARKHKGLSQNQLAEISGVGQGTISKIERGGQDCSAADIKLALALDISPVWLSEGDERYIPEWLSTVSIQGQLDDVTGSIHAAQHVPETKPSYIDISKLIPTASPATQDLLKTLERGLQEGRLDEEFIKILDTLIKKAMDDKNRKNR
jgi:transcriptional regulator with XRE-family HTH domain